MGRGACFPHLPGQQHWHFPRPLPVALLPSVPLSPGLSPALFSGSLVLMSSAADICDSARDYISLWWGHFWGLELRLLVSCVWDGRADYGSSGQGHPTALVETRNAAWQHAVAQLALGQVPPRGLSSMGLGLLGKPPGKLSVTQEVLQRGLGTVKVNVQPGRGSSASFLISIYQALPNING